MSEILTLAENAAFVYWVTGGAFLIGGAAAYFAGGRRRME